MKLSRRLIPAFAMLLVSAVLMSTASFAWFSMNNSVTATGMQVTATADSSIVIRAKGGNSFANTASYAVGNKTLNPTTTFDCVNFGKLASNVVVGNPDNATADWGTGAPAIDELIPFTKAATDFASYVQKAVYEVKSVGGNANVFVKDIQISYGETEEDEEELPAGLLNSIRVAVNLGDNETGTWLIYRPYTDGQTANISVAHLVDGAWVIKNADYATTGEAIATQTAAGATQIGQLTYDSTTTATDNAAVDLTVYVWFEGQDPDCTSNNAAIGNNFDVTITFGAEFPTPAPEEPVDPDAGE